MNQHYKLTRGYLFPQRRKRSSLTGAKRISALTCQRHNTLPRDTVLSSYRLEICSVQFRPDKESVLDRLWQIPLKRP
jgi:hypothetical protein